MSRGFEAITSVTIDAPAARVWQALTDPAKVRQYMHGTNLATDWRVGSPISWSGEWRGKAYEDKGVVLDVTCELSGDEGQTILTLTQDNNATQEAADQMAENNWGPMLRGLKETAET